MLLHRICNVKLLFICIHKLKVPLILRNHRIEMGKQKSTKSSKVITDSTSFSIVLFYCLLIIFLPILSFFSSKFFIFDSILNVTSIQSNIYAAITAIVALHLALGLFLYRAYFDSDPSPQKQD